MKQPIVKYIYVKNGDFLGSKIGKKLSLAIRAAVDRHGRPPPWYNYVVKYFESYF